MAHICIFDALPFSWLQALGKWTTSINSLKQWIQKLKHDHLLSFPFFICVNHWPFAGLLETEVENGKKTLNVLAQEPTLERTSCRGFARHKRCQHTGLRQLGSLRRSWLSFSSSCVSAPRWPPSGYLKKKCIVRRSKRKQHKRPPCVWR